MDGACSLSVFEVFNIEAEQSRARALEPKMIEGNARYYGAGAGAI